MSALLASEIRRLRSRRLGLVIVVLALLGILIGGIVAFVRSSDEGRMDIVEADPQLGVSLDSCEQGEFGIPDEVAEEAGGIREACLDAIGVSDPTFLLTDIRPILQGTTVPLIFIGWLIGATFVGADWQKGTMTTVLTWESRRLRLWGAKILACLLVVFAGYLFLQLMLGLALLPAALVRGSTAGADRVWVTETVGTLLRGGVVTMLASIVGMSIAMIGRNTGAALGAGFAYLAIVESLIRGLRPGWVPYLFGDNSAVFITADPQSLPEVGRSTAEAALVLIIYAVALGAVAAATFRTRDVT